MLLDLNLKGNGKLSNAQNCPIRGKVATRTRS